MSSRREKNQFSGRRKRRPHIDRILIFLTGTLVLVTLALYIGPRVQPWLSPKPALVEASVVIEAGKESLISAISCLIRRQKPAGCQIRPA